MKVFCSFCCAEANSINFSPLFMMVTIYLILIISIELYASKILGASVLLGNEVI